MTVAERSTTSRTSRPGRGGRGGLHTVLLAVAALLVVPSAASASQTHVLSEQGWLTKASLTGKITLYNTDDLRYEANFWIRNGTADSSSVSFRYHYVTGAVHTTRTWGNPNGPGTSVNHVAWMGREGQSKVPRVRFISVVLTSGGSRRTCHFPNKYVLGSGSYGTTVRCGTTDPPPPPKVRAIRISPSPAPSNPASPPVTAPQAQPAPPPVVLPGAGPVARPKAPRGCTPSDHPIVAKLKMRRGKRRAAPRILSVTYSVRRVRSKGKKRTVPRKPTRRGNRRALRKAGHVKVARRRPFRASLSNGFQPGARVRVHARIRYRWHGQRKVHTRTTRRVIRLCA